MAHSLFNTHSHEAPFEGHQAATAIVHASSLVEAPCRIGEYTAVYPFSHIMANAVIGNDCHIGHHVTIGNSVLIGHGVKVMNNALLNSGVIVEDDVYCGPSTVFAPIQRMRSLPGYVSPVRPTMVRKNASIGPNSTIAAGVTIGCFTFIEAGSVIDRNVPNFALVYGNPLTFIGWRCECGAALDFGVEDDSRCTQCDRQYQRQSDTCIVQLADPSNHDHADNPSCTKYSHS